MKPKRVLVTPLDWGLGHATRCIPIIRTLLNENCEVQIGGAGASLHLLRAEFPELKFHELPAYAPVYSNAKSLVWKLFLQVPKFLKAIKKEHKAVSKIIAGEEINILISDNRYGVWSNTVPSVFITHQLNILPPKNFGWLRPLLRLGNYHLLKKFTVCWIPDLPDRSLSGILSLPFKKINTKYVGFLSRFTEAKILEKEYDILILLSGPEPQRSVLENILTDQLKESIYQTLFVRGLPGVSSTPASTKNIQFVNHLPTPEMAKTMASSKFIIARSGYSSIMDLTHFQAKCILIPTPGQTEQEYLATWLLKKEIAYSCKQNDFTLTYAMEKAMRFKQPFPKNDMTLLRNAINELLDYG